MSWTNELYKVYENNCDRPDLKNPILPIAHYITNAHLTVKISQKGEFLSADKIDKNDSVTTIPVTEKSAGARTSAPCAHPLNDKLQYLAGDYTQYVTGKNPKDSYFLYTQQLKNWCDSQYTNAAVEAIYAYVSKGSLIGDLVNYGIFEVDENGRLRQDVKINGIAQSDVFIRFEIEYDDIDKEGRTWLDKSLYDNYIAYYTHDMGNEGLCYATGNVGPIAEMHPAKLRNAGDMGKLFSAGDTEGFTYRGRFTDKSQVMSIGYDFSQKMHNALRWLIANQGFAVNTMSVTIWESALSPLPDIKCGYSDDLWFEEDAAQPIADTVPMYKDRLQKMIFGYKEKFSAGSKVMIMAVDAASTGRDSISMYSELDSSDYLNNIEIWHENTSWYKFSSKLKKEIIGSFSIYDIANCAFGTEQNGHIKCKPETSAKVFLRLIPCITEGRPIPRDIVNALLIKATNPLAYDENYNYRKVLEVACGMLKKQIIERKGVCEVGLDENNHNRSYLFGRLLAVAEKAENDSFSDEDKNKRITNARKFHRNFVQNPSVAWQCIFDRLDPAFKRLGGYRVRYEKLIGDISAKFENDDYSLRKPLLPEYLLGYHCQLHELYKPTKQNNDNNITEE